MIPKVKFIIDRECDQKMVHYMINTKDPAGNWNRAKAMGLTKKQFLFIRKKKTYMEAKKFIKEIANPLYEKFGKKLKQRQKQYQKDWNKIDKTFFKEIERITRYKWEHKKYDVVLSVFHRGLTFARNDWVVRWIQTFPIEHRRITAHEILMTHIWKIFHLKHKKRIYTIKLWNLNEITTVALLGLEPTLNKLWSKNQKGYDNFLSNYPQLKKLQKKLKKVYLEKKDFNDYLNKALKIKTK